MIFSEKKSAAYRAKIQSSVTINVDGCWIWGKSKAWNGYGRFSLGGGKAKGAHRVSYAVFVGEAIEGLDVCHRCDVRDCVNPEHLFLGTRSENILDASAKNRVSRTHQVKGSKHPSSKLTEQDVGQILNRLQSGESKKHLSGVFGVSQRVILLIARGELWKHVPRVPA